MTRLTSRSKACSAPGYLNPTWSKTSRAGRARRQGRALRCPDRGARGAGNGGRGVQDLEHALGRGGGFLAAGQDVAHRLDGPDQRQGQRDERDQPAQGQLVPADRDGAEQQQDADERVRDEVQASPEGAAQPGFLQLGAEHLECLAAVLPGGLVTPAERLEYPDPGRGLLHVGGQIALLVLGAPGEHPVGLLEPGAGRHHGQEHGRREEAEPPVQPDQQRDHRDERDHVRDQEDGAEAGEPPDGRQVRGRPGQQLAGLPLVVEGGLQPLQVRVDIRPHGLFHPGDRAGLHPAPEEVQQRLPGPQADGGHADRQQQLRAPRG